MNDLKKLYDSINTASTISGGGIPTIPAVDINEPTEITEEEFNKIAHSAVIADAEGHTFISFDRESSPEMFMSHKTLELGDKRKILLEIDFFTNYGAYLRDNIVNTHGSIV